MTDLEEDKTGYTVTFSISVQNNMGEVWGLSAREIDFKNFTGKVTYKTNNEAIDAVINELCSLKDKE